MSRSSRKAESAVTPTASAPVAPDAPVMDESPGSTPDTTEVAATAVSPVPVTFGRYLQGEREKKGLSLDDLAHLTKIRRAILEAVENEQRRDLPERVFVAGYVRSCALAMSLPAEDVLRRFHASWSDEATTRVEAQVDKKAASKVSYAWVPPVLAAAFFLAVVLLVINF